MPERTAGAGRGDVTVLVVLNSLGLGGTQINAVDFARAAAGRGIRSVLVGYRHTLPTAGPSLLDVAAERGVGIEVIDRPRGTLATGAVLRRLADRAGADVVHAYGAWESRPSFWGPARLGSRPLVVTVYEMAVPVDVPPSSHLIIGTRLLLDEQQQCGRRGPVRLISPPVDLSTDASAAVDGTAFRAAVGVGSQDTLIVTVSRLAHEMKAAGIETMMRAMDRVPPHTVYAVVGDGDAAPHLAGVAAQVNADLGRQAVRLVGSLADPRPAYAAADVVVGMGGSAARGLAFGKPLVAVGEAGWFRRFEPATAPAVFHNSFYSTDVVADPASELLDALAPLLTSATTRERLGAFGREFAVTHFGLDAMTDVLVELYHDVTVGGHRHRWPAGWLHDLRSEAHAVARKAARVAVRRAGPATAAGAVR